MNKGGILKGKIVLPFSIRGSHRESGRKKGARGNSKVKSCRGIARKKREALDFR